MSLFFVLKSVLDELQWSRTFRFASFWFPALWWQEILTDEILKRWALKYGGPIGPHCIVNKNKEVREKIAPERLLEFDVRQGWEPLCKVSKKGCDFIL